MKIFPADGEDVNAGLQMLADKGFILRYASGSKRYGQVIAWKKHQNPHFKEQMSVIPSPESLGFDVHASGSLPEASPIIDDTDASGIDADDEGQGTASNASMMQKPEALPPSMGGQTVLIPDSRFLIPDSLEEREKPFLLEQAAPANPTKPRKPKAPKLPSRFDEFWAIYPRKVARKAAATAFAKAAATDELVATILEAIAKQAKSFKWRNEPQFIPHASTWLNGERWKDVVDGIAPPSSNAIPAAEPRKYFTSPNLANPGPDAIAGVPGDKTKTAQIIRDLGRKLRIS
jgi:hypothetical protein